MIKQYFLDKKHRIPRVWSNMELKKFAHYFKGNIINVSAYLDEDKQGGTYGSDYFINANSYSCSNYDSNKRGFQGSLPNEFYLDLETDLDPTLIEKYDVVFNHTTLEHIYDFKNAFKNICLLSNDIVIMVLPFLQEQHADYGDYWRFSPIAIELMFKEQGLKTFYINYNDRNNESIYVFALATKNWDSTLNNKIAQTKGNKINEIGTHLIGSGIITNKILYTFLSYLKRYHPRLR